MVLCDQQLRFEITDSQRNSTDDAPADDLAPSGAKESDDPLMGAVYTGPYMKTHFINAHMRHQVSMS